MSKNLLLAFVLTCLFVSCERNEIPRQPYNIQIESITFTELPKFIDIINYDDMETYRFTIDFSNQRFENLLITGAFDLKDPAIYNSTDGLLQPLVFELQDDILPFPPSFEPTVNYTRPNVDNVFVDDFIVPRMSYDDIYNDDLATEFEYEYIVVYTPQDGLGRLDGTFRYTVKGKFFY